MLYFGGILCIFNLFLFSLVITKRYYSNLNEALMMTVGNLQWNLYDVLLVIIVIRATTAAAGEGKKTISMINKAINESTDGKFNGRVGAVFVFKLRVRTFLSLFSHSQLMNFSQQISSNRLDFSCGLFNYDWSLCLKVWRSQQKTYFQISLSMISVYQRFCDVFGNFNSIWIGTAEEEWWKTVEVGSLKFNGRINCCWYKFKQLKLWR